MVSFPSEVMSLILSFNNRTQEREAACMKISVWLRAACNQRPEYRRLGWSEVTNTSSSNGSRGHTSFYRHREYALHQYDQPTFRRPLSQYATKTHECWSGQVMHPNAWQYYWTLLKGRMLTLEEENYNVQ